MHALSDTLLTKDPSPEYREAVGRALDIPTSRVVPFFGGFLRELKAIVTGVPSVVVLPTEENQSLEVGLCGRTGSMGGGGAVVVEGGRGTVNGALGGGGRGREVAVNGAFGVGGGGGGREGDS